MLEVTSIYIYEYFNFHKFSLLQAVQGCLNLKALDLSGILQNTDLVAFAQHNITLFNLETLKLAYNKVTSIKQVIVIGAPKLRNLDLAQNLITTIDSEIVHKYQGLVSLNVQENKLTSLASLDNLDSLQILRAASNKITSSSVAIS